MEIGRKEKRVPTTKIRTGVGHSYCLDMQILLKAQFKETISTFESKHPN